MRRGESLTVELDAMATAVAFEVEKSYDGSSSTETTMEYDPMTSIESLQLRQALSEAECVRLRKRERNLRKEAKRFELEAETKKIEAETKLEERDRVRKEVHRLREDRDERRVVQWRADDERQRRSKASDEDLHLRRRELAVALGDLDRVERDVKNLELTNKNLANDLRKYQRASLGEDFKDDHFDSEDDEETVSLPQYAVATPIDVIDCCPQQGLQRDLLLTLRVVDDDDVTFYRVPRRLPLAETLGPAHRRSPREKAFVLLLCCGDDDDDDDDDKDPIDVSLSPAELGFDDLAVLRCSKRHRYDDDRIVMVVRCADATVDDAYYYVDKDDMLDGLFKAHIAGAGPPSLGFFTYNGDRQLRPAETPSSLGFRDVAFVMCI